MSSELTSSELTDANRAALAQVAAHAELLRPQHVERIRRVLAGVRIDIDPEVLLSALGGYGTVTMNFHPDRLIPDGRSVAQALHDEGVYRSQFETGISNGALSAHPGGDRDSWEHSLFAGAYQQPNVLAGERPKYGGMNIMRHLNGACPRFGSCHLRLRHEATKRASLVFGDSNANPADVGLVDAFAPVLAPLLESIMAGAGALGRSVDVPAFVDGLLRGDHLQGRGVFAPAMTHALNDYIEAQVHGELRLAADVEAVVIDPAFRGTPAGDLLLTTARRHGLHAEWHAGLGLALADVPQAAPDAPEADLMRWQAFCAHGRAFRLAQRVVDDQGAAPRLDATNIGQAAISVIREPERWHAWGQPQEVIVHLKDLWLMLVAHGQPLV